MDAKKYHNFTFPLFPAQLPAGLMQRFFSGVKPVSTRRYYDKSSS